MNDVKNWAIFKQLTDDFKSSIKFVYIFCGGVSMIIVTNDDNVYAFGSNSSGYLGLGHQNAIDKPTKVEELCHKKVIDIKFTSYSLIAITKIGPIYSWGENNYGQLGNGTKDACFTPYVVKTLINKVLAEVKCGAHHCLALTENGEVFEWGWSVSGVHNTTPIKVRSGLELHTITAISCGEYHSLALTDNGDVYSWGMNHCGQCGTGSYVDNQLIPIKINTNGYKVIKISCGLNHSMILSDKKDIYTFGYNNFGQLGNESKKKSIVPLMIHSYYNKFEDIGAHNIYNYNISIGLSRDGYCYVWGECGEQKLTSPAKTELKSIDETLAYYSKYKVTYKPYYFEQSFEQMSIFSRVGKAFNNESLSDVAFKIDGKHIYAQKSHLKTVCQHFIAMFSDNVWLESNAKVIEITQYSYSVYYSFLKYLYTDSVDIESKHLIELYYLSDSYFEERLKTKCIEMMKNDTNINNAFNYWSFAVHINLENLEKYFFDYMKPRIKDIIETEAYLQADTSILQKFSLII